MANEAQVTKQGPADDEDGAHRLRDIVVEEVSLVDRAANKRRFLVVKRSDDMADDDKHEGEKDERETGGRRRDKAKKKAKPKPEEAEAEKARRAADDDEEETEKARRRAAPEDDESETEKAGGDDDGDDEEEGDDEVEKARAKPKPTVGGRPEANEDEKDGITEKADDEDGDDDDLVLPAAAKNAVLGVLAQALERLMGIANRVKAAEEPDGESEPEVPDDIGEELEEIGELLEDVGERFEGATEKLGVKKAGARMAKDRLDRFQKALALLSEVLKELTESKKPKEPTAGAAEAKVEKRDAAPGMADLVASIGELTRVVKRQEDELARIRKTRGVSNAIPIDGGGRRGEPQEVSWPLDMNRPISRDSVNKAVSFYDE